MKLRRLLVLVLIPIVLLGLGSTPVSAVTYSGPFEVYHWDEGGFISFAGPASGTTSTLYVWANGIYQQGVKFQGAWSHTSVYKTITLYSRQSIRFKCEADITAALIIDWVGFFWLSIANVKCTAEIRNHNTGVRIWAYTFYTRTLGPCLPATWSYSGSVDCNQYVGYLNAGSYDFVVYLSAAVGVGAWVCGSPSATYTSANLVIDKIGY